LQNLSAAGKPIFKGCHDSFQIIDLRRDPHGTQYNRGKPTIKTGGNAVKKNPLQTMEDKLRIANKVG
jgi:hypothetical protein